jgi:hypothetical protein
VALEKCLMVEQFDAMSEWIAAGFTSLGAHETNRASGAGPAQR